MSKGEIYLICFPFSDLTGSKLRPAILLKELNHDCIFCFINSNLKNKSTYSILIKSNGHNNLKFNSLILPEKIANLNKSLIYGKLGKISDEELNEININLKEILTLD